jgi:hypothetical protein
MPVSKRLRYEVLRRDNHTCRYCGSSAPDVKLTVDHVMPVALGGTDDPSNLVAACASCNSGKSATPPDAALVSDVADDAIRWAKAITTAARADARKRQDRDNFRNYFEDEWIQYRFAWDNRIAPLGDHWQESIDRFKSLGLTPSDMDEAVAVAMRKDMPIDRRWRYFCGVCWNMVERRHADALEIVRAGDV